MKLPRRQFLHLTAIASTLPAMSRATRAQAYPSRPVTIVVPYAAGGPTDVIARVLVERMRQQLGQPVLVEKRQLRMFRPLMKRDYPDFMSPYGTGSGHPRALRTISSTSSMPLPCTRWPIRWCVPASAILGCSFRRGRSRRRRRLAHCKRPKSRSGGRSSRRRTSRVNENPAISGDATP
jgi:hypothetical protein